MKTGELLISILDGFYNREPSRDFFNLIETGCIRSDDPREDLPVGHGMEGAGWSTLYFAQWLDSHPFAEMYSCDIDRSHVEIAMKVLVDHHAGAARSHFNIGDSVKFIEEFPEKIDFAYLNSSDDHEHGFQEFLVCEKKAVPFVVMDDYQSKCLLAVGYAKGRGYKVERNHRFTIIELS